MAAPGLAASGLAAPGAPVIGDRDSATTGWGAWKADIGAGLVVFLIALPLCLGIALASGAPMLSGIVTGVVGGLVVSRLSGSQLMVSGPAAGLTAIVLSAISTLGSFEVFLVAVILAGAMQLVLGALKAGIIGYYFPTSVIRGMLVAIGITLIIKQLPYAFGIGHEVFESDAFQVAGGGNNVTVIGDTLRNMLPGAALLSMSALLVLVVWPKIAPAKVKAVMPAPLAAVLLGVAGSMLLANISPVLALPQSAMVALPVTSSPAELFGMLSFPSWGAIGNPAVWRVAVTIAIVASLETLLSLEATDRLDPLKRTSPTNRELAAQGAGNMLSGFFGGLPMTGVIVRSAANASAGARTWRSSFLHGVFLLSAVLTLPALLNRIPLAVLAAILLFTGYSLANPRTFLVTWKAGWKQFVPFAVTIAAILATDLLIGITVGLATGAFFVLLDSWSNAYSYHIEESADHHSVRLVLAEEVTFLNKARISQALHAVPPDSAVVVDATRTRHLDRDVAELLNDFRETARSKRIGLRLLGVPDTGLASMAH